MEPPTPTPYVQGGRFLEAYRKLSARLEELDPAGSQHGRTPKQDGCETVPCWEPHSFAYVLGNANENVAFEIAAALAQFEPVTMAVEGRQAYVRARRSLPDNIRLVQLFDVPDSWTGGNPISFTRALAGDLRVIEYNCADAPQGSKPTLFRQICEVERIHRFGGPMLGRGVSLGPEQPFVEVNGRGQVLLSPASDGNLDGGRDEDLAANTSSHRRPHEMTLFAKGQHSVVCFANARFSQDGGVIVPRTTSKASADALRAQVGQVHELDERYMGFFVANGGVLVPAYGKKDIDLRAMKVLARLFPKRRVVQIQTSRPRLNINDFVLGFPGPKPRAAPGSKILRASAALTQMNQTQQDILQRRLLLDQRRTRIFSLRLPSSENADNVEDSEDGQTDTFEAMQSQRSLLASSRTSSPSRHQQRMMQQQHELKLSSSRSNALCAIDAANGSQSDVGEAELARQVFPREGSASNLLSRSSLGSDCREEQSASGLQLGQMEASHNVRTGSASRVTSSSELVAPIEPPLEADTIGLVEDPQPQFTLTEPPTGGKSATRFTSTLGIFSKRRTSTRKSDKLQVPEDGPAKDNDPPTL